MITLAPRRTTWQPDELVERFRAGQPAALARAISWAENQEDGIAEVLDAVYPLMGNAWRTGITGPPGAGKSTLTNALTRHWSSDGKRTALLAVDPSSPFSGGALLGDRVRMDRAIEEADVFVRSMASRGSLGGLAFASGIAVDLMDSFGFREVVLETVGVGQAEIDIASAADVTVVVLTAHSGDGVQAMKAGLMEVADLFVVNKADLGSNDRFVMELESVLELRDASQPRPQVISCSALHENGVHEVLQAIEDCRQHQQASGRLETRRRARALNSVQRMVAENLRGSLWEDGGLKDAAKAALLDGRRPHRAAEDLLQQVKQQLRVALQPNAATGEEA